MPLLVACHSVEYSGSSSASLRMKHVHHPSCLQAWCNAFSTLLFCSPSSGDVSVSLLSADDITHISAEPRAAGWSTLSPGSSKGPFGRIYRESMKNMFLSGITPLETIFTPSSTQPLALQRSKCPLQQRLHYPLEIITDRHLQSEIKCLSFKHLAQTPLPTVLYF